MNVTLQHAHLNMMLKTHHLIYNENEIVSITQVKDSYDVRYVNGKREFLKLNTRVETIRK